MLRYHGGAMASPLEVERALLKGLENAVEPDRETWGTGAQAERDAAAMMAAFPAARPRPRPDAQEPDPSPSSERPR